VTAGVKKELHFAIHFGGWFDGLIRPTHGSVDAHHSPASGTYRKRWETWIGGENGSPKVHYQLLVHVMTGGPSKLDAGRLAKVAEGARKDAAEHYAALTKKIEKKDAKKIGGDTSDPDAPTACVPI
jgi:hypothetical protein